MKNNMSDKRQFKTRLRKDNLSKNIKNKDKKSESIFLKVILSSKYLNAKSIFIYLSTEKEVNTEKIINDALERGKTVLVPVIAGKDMETHIIDKNTSYAIGKYSIKKPIDGEISDIIPDLTILPMLGFYNRERLGKGAGYYDRYLAKRPSTYKMGICFSDYLLNCSFAEPHDIEMDEVITD